MKFSGVTRHQIGDCSDDSQSEEELRVTEFGNKNHVIIDVGGERFQAEKGRFLKFPNTRLGTDLIDIDLDTLK